MSIEDATKKLKKFCDYEDSVVLIDNALIEIQDAIEIVLGNLEALCDMQKSADRELENAKKINEEHRKENADLMKAINVVEKEKGEWIEDCNNLKKKVKELEEERQLVGMPVKNKRSGKIGIVLHQWESGSIAVLENISPRIINTHDSWNTLEIINDEIKQIKTGSDSIPKQKAKEMQARIKELEEELYSANKIVEEYLDGVPKLKIKNIIKELNNEYKKIDDSIDIYSNSDDRGKIDCLQMIGWLEGKLQELLQESEDYK